MVARNYLRIRLPLLLAVTALGTSCRERAMLRMHQDSPGIDTKGAVHDALPTAPSTRTRLLTGDADQKLTPRSVGASSAPLIHDAAVAEHIQYIHACAQTVTPQSLPKVIAKLAWIEINLQKAYSKVKPEEKEYLQSILGKLEERRIELIHARKAMGQDAPRAWWIIFATPTKDLVEDTLASLEKSTKLLERYPKLAPKVVSRILGVLQKVDKEKICAPESTLKHVINFLREALQRVPQHTRSTLLLMKRILRRLRDNEKEFDNACIDKRLIDILARVSERNSAHVKGVLKVLDTLYFHFNVHVVRDAIRAYMEILKNHPQYGVPAHTAYLQYKVLQINEYLREHESKPRKSVQQVDVKHQKDEKVIGTATQSAPRVGLVQAPQAVLRRPTVQLHTPVGSNEYIPASGGPALPAIAEAP